MARFHSPIRLFEEKRFNRFSTITHTGFRQGMRHGKYRLCGRLKGNSDAFDFVNIVKVKVSNQPGMRLVPVRPYENST